MLIRAMSDVVSELGEGPIWCPKTKTVTWTDIVRNTIHRTVLETGETKSFKIPTMVGAIALDSNGNYIAATQEGFAQISFQGRFSKLHSFLAGDMRMNDGKVDPHGRFWAGSLALTFESNRGALYVLENNESYTKILDSITLSNGMGWSPEANYFYFIDSIPGVLKRFKYDSKNGQINDPTELIVFNTDKGVPDGMCITNDGKIVIALWDGGRIEIYSPKGKKISEIKLEISRPTSCTFGGADGNILIVTSASQGLNIEMEPLAGKTLAITDTGLNGPPPYLYG